jgi:hypothetical protein
MISTLPEQAQKARQYGSLKHENMSENSAAPVAKHGEPSCRVSALLQREIGKITYRTTREGIIERVDLRGSLQGLS